MTKEVLDAVQVLEAFREKARKGEVGTSTPVMRPSDRDEESGDQRDHRLMDRTILSAVRLQMLRKELARPIRVPAEGVLKKEAVHKPKRVGGVASARPGVEDIPER